MAVLQHQELSNSHKEKIDEELWESNLLLSRIGEIEGRIRSDYATGNGAIRVFWGTVGVPDLEFSLFLIRAVQKNPGRRPRKAKKTTRKTKRISAGKSSAESKRVSELYRKVLSQHKPTSKNYQFVRKNVDFAAENFSSAPDLLEAILEITKCFDDWFEKKN